MEDKQLINEIQDIDNQIASAFVRRMQLISQLSQTNSSTGLIDREVIASVTRNQSEEIAGYIQALFHTILDLTRISQLKHEMSDKEMQLEMINALHHEKPLFPKNAIIACQGIEGANSQHACEKLFARPSIMYMSHFESVFSAVDKGLCQYGILPVENNLHGSVNEVYDLMRKHHFHIVRSVKVKINHTLLAKNDVPLSEIKEIYSHPQALAQCGKYLKGLKHIKLTPCENTAIAAKMVYESSRKDIAAISSLHCAELYHLYPLARQIQDSDHNYTRFICIAKEIELYSGADKISLMFTIPHRPGELYGMIAKFSALGLNLTKLESRPIPGTDFEFMFYIDLNASLHQKEVINLLASLGQVSDSFAFLGNYSEIG